MSRREYDRSARLSTLLREIIAERVEALDDPRLYSVSLTGVDVDNELEKAVVFYDADDAATAGEAFDDHAGELRRAISTQARLRRTPRLEFRADQAVAGGSRIEAILAGLDIPPEEAEDAAGDDAPSA